MPTTELLFTAPCQDKTLGTGVAVRPPARPKLLRPVAGLVPAFSDVLAQLCHRETNEAAQDLVCSVEGCARVRALDGARDRAAVHTDSACFGVDRAGGGWY